MALKVVHLRLGLALLLGIPLWMPTGHLQAQDTGARPAANRVVDGEIGRIQALDVSLNLSSLISNALVRKGYENIFATAADSQLVISYENRRYRHELDALREVLSTASKTANSLEAGRIRQIRIIPQHRGIPIAVFTTPPQAYPDAQSGHITERGIRGTLDISKDLSAIIGQIQSLRSPSFREFDVVVHPQFKAQFGAYGNPVRSQTNLAPEITTTLRRGMSLSAQLVIPLQNELGPDGDYVRPGRLTLSQLFRLPKTTFLSVTLGHFTRDRYGLDVKSKKYLGGGQWSLGAQVGITGGIERDRWMWQYGQEQTVTALLNSSFRNSRYDVEATFAVGKFLYQDTGFRLDILRQFGEVDVGFFALHTGLGWNAGFNFSIPIPPSKNTKARRLRVRPAREFDWEYRYWGIARNGVMYETGNSIDDIFQDWERYSAGDTLPGYTSQ